MADTMPELNRSGHLLRSAETRPRMAKANLRSAEIGDWPLRLGRAIERAMRLRGWNLNEFADAINRDPRQVARWFIGKERPQFDAMFAVDSFRQPLVISLAELGGAGVELETIVRIRRSA